MMTSQTHRIYLDYSATTPVDPEVTEAMSPYFTRYFGNASSIHAFGRETKILLEESREKIARAVGAKAGEIFFTSGGTEADNHALFGAAFASKRSHGKNHIIVSSVEHHAVLRSAEYLGGNGFDVTILPVDEFGKVDPDEVRAAILPGTSLVSVMHANNEIGTIQDVEEISRVAHDHGLVFHSDTVQSVGKIPVNVDALSMDILAISAHKFYGPKGIGAIYIRKGVDVDSYIHGGAQERNRRAGTENIPFAVGLAKAIEASQRDMEKNTRHISTLKKELKRLLSERFECILFNGHPTDAIPNIVNVSFDSTKTDVDGEALLLNMDLHGVAVTSGSACSSGSMEPSHVLQAIGRDIKTAKSSIRFSMGKHTTEDEIVEAVNILEQAVRQSTVAPV
ncbi:MAG: cysteine desulfurase family protein [Bacteroidota bacterium]